MPYRNGFASRGYGNVASTDTYVIGNKYSSSSFQLFQRYKTISTHLTFVDTKTIRITLLIFGFVNFWLLLFNRGLRWYLRFHFHKYIAVLIGIQQRQRVRNKNTVNTVSHVDTLGSCGSVNLAYTAYIRPSTSVSGIPAPVYVSSLCLPVSILLTLPLCPGAASIALTYSLVVTAWWWGRSATRWWECWCRCGRSRWTDL